MCQFGSVVFNPFNKLEWEKEMAADLVVDKSTTMDGATRTRLMTAFPSIRKSTISV